MATKNPYFAIVNFMYFTTNFPQDFIEKCWEGQDNLITHLQKKIRGIVGKSSTCTAEHIIHFCLGLSREHQVKLAQWIDRNYEAATDLHWQMKPPEEVEPGDIAQDYNGEEGHVVRIVKVKDWEQIVDEDSTGWVDEDSIKEFELDPEEDYLIVVFFADNGIDDEDGPGETIVYTYGPDGACVME